MRLIKCFLINLICSLTLVLLISCNNNFGIINNVKKDINNHLDYSLYTIHNISSSNYIQRIDNVKYGGSRKTDELVYYNQSNYEKTNIYGFEIALDKYGKVVDKATNVLLPPNGAIISAHGIRQEDLKKIDIGSFVIYNDDLFVYERCNLSKYNNILLDYIEVENRIKNILFINIIEYNKLIDLLNEINISLDKAIINNLEIDEKTINNLFDLSNKINNLYNLYELENTHTFTILKNNDLNKLEERKSSNNLTLMLTYLDTLYYGGFRNADTLVYYDASLYYRERNNYGYEVGIDSTNHVVSFGKVVDIPVDGFVLSGHSSTVNFIKQINIGDYVEIKDNKVYIYRDVVTSKYNEIINRRNSLLDSMNLDILNNIPHDYILIHKLFKKVDSLLNCIYFNEQNIGSTLLNNYNIDLINNYLMYILAILSYNQSKTHGMWYYPFVINGNDTSLEEVNAAVKTLHDMDINEILINVFYNGYALFENDYIYMYSQLNSYDYGEYKNDYLSCFINEAHKYNIKVTAFTQTFASHINTMINPIEDYYQLGFDGQKSRGNIYYYDICNDFVQNMLLDIYEDLITQYDFDGIEYDIIRYPESTLYNYLNTFDINVDALVDPGYTIYSMNKFMNEYNYSGDLKELIVTNKQVRLDWLTFKQNELDNFVNKLSNLIRSIKPDIKISAAVMGNYDNAKNVYLQDGLKWLELGYIDLIEPMFYSGDKEEFLNRFNSYVGKGYDDSIRIGISVRNTLVDNNLDFYQMDYCCAYNGYILFSNALYLKDKNFVELMINNH